MTRNSYISDEEVVKRENASIQIELEKKALDIPADSGGYIRFENRENI